MVLFYFLLYINDIVNDIGCNIRLFADDTSLFVIVENPDSAAELINTDMGKISTWAGKWLVKFNPGKNESFVVSLKTDKPVHPPLFMLNEQIKEVQCHKHLGIYLSTDCSWHKHIEYIKEKAWARINVMRKFKYTLDRKSLETIYITFIRPILEYADIIWDNCTQQEKNDLEKIQLEAARIATGATKLVSIENLYDETGWEKLETRRKNHKLTLFYKMFNNISPTYLSSLVPQLVQNVSNYNLRNADDIPLCDCRSGAIENADHFFLRCHLYREHRVALQNSILQYSIFNLNVILKGDENLSYETNVSIFESVHKYIQNTNRF